MLLSFSGQSERKGGVIVAALLSMFCAAAGPEWCSADLESVISIDWHWGAVCSWGRDRGVQLHPTKETETCSNEESLRCGRNMTFFLVISFIMSILQFFYSPTLLIISVSSLFSCFFFFPVILSNVSLSIQTLLPVHLVRTSSTSHFLTPCQSHFFVVLTFLHHNQSLCSSPTGT